MALPCFSARPRNLTRRRPRAPPKQSRASRWQALTKRRLRSQRHRARPRARQGAGRPRRFRRAQSRHVQRSRLRSRQRQSSRRLRSSLLLQSSRSLGRSRLLRSCRHQQNSRLQSSSRRRSSRPPSRLPRHPLSSRRRGHRHHRHRPRRRHLQSSHRLLRSHGLPSRWSSFSTRSRRQSRRRLHLGRTKNSHASLWKQRRAGSRLKAAATTAATTMTMKTRMWSGSTALQRLCLCPPPGTSGRRGRARRSTLAWCSLLRRQPTRRPPPGSRRPGPGRPSSRPRRQIPRAKRRLAGRRRSLRPPLRVSAMARLRGRLPRWISRNPHCGRGQGSRG